MGNCLNHIFWKFSSSWQFKHMQCLIFILCLAGLQAATNGREAKLQRRFMWKQMDMENLVNGMSSGARAMKHMLAELVPTKQTTSMLDFLPSETTRVKYIIRNPTSKRPVKIIKMRPSKKVIKMASATQVTHIREKNPPNTHKPLKLQEYLSEEEMHKLEKEQELIAEGRSPPKAAAELIDTVKADTSKGSVYTQPAPDNNDIVNGKYVENNGWSPVYDHSKAPVTFLDQTNKPAVMSPLHTNIMSEPLPKPEQLISQPSAKSKDEPDQEDEDSIKFNHYYEAPRENHGYEVTEYIAEESMALPQTQSAHINIRAGVASSKYVSYTPPQINGSIKQQATTIITTTTTEEPPNYPASFLRNFQERNTALTTAASSSGAAAASRARFRASAVESNDSWLPKIASYNQRPTHRTKPQHASNLAIRMKSEKWPPEVAAMPLPSMSSQLGEAYAPSNGLMGSMRQLALAPTITPTSTKQLALNPSNGRLRKTQATATAQSSPKQSGEAPKSRNIRHRGTIKFGDKTYDEN